MNAINDLDIANIDIDELPGEYDDTGAPFILPPKGRYTLRATSTPEYGEVKFGGKTHFSVRIDPTILVGPPGAKIPETFALRFISVNTAKSQFKNSSSLGDYIRAAGVDLVLRGTTKEQRLQEYETALRRALPEPFVADLDWFASCSNCTDVNGKRLRLRGMDKFPVADEGRHSQFVPCPQCGEDLPARLEVKRYISKFARGTLLT